MKKIKFNNIVFRNYFNCGDLHAVRSFIKYIVNNFKGFDYKLNHPRSIKTLGDLNIPLFWRQNQIPRTFDNRGYHIEYGTLIINTQYLAFNGSHFKKHSATLLTPWNIFNQTLQEVFDVELPKDYISFLPQINYNHKMYNIKPINDIVRNDRKNVLICNNAFESEQSTRFDFIPVIQQVSETFTDVDFYVTNKVDVEKDNIKYVPDIVGQSDSDLNEISYLSTKCDILIGRNSGPHTFCYVRENMLNTKKKFISFSPSSNLYGNDPTKWVDFGIRNIIDKTQCAEFNNIIEFDDKVRISKICNIIGE